VQRHGNAGPPRYSKDTPRRVDGLGKLIASGRSGSARSARRCGSRSTKGRRSPGHVLQAVALDPHRRPPVERALAAGRQADGTRCGTAPLRASTQIVRREPCRSGPLCRRLRAPMPTKRQVLDLLTRDELSALVDRHSVIVSTRRGKPHLVERLDERRSSLRRRPRRAWSRVRSPRRRCGPGR
jgi:hypothetical protein